MRDCDLKLVASCSQLALKVYVCKHKYLGRTPRSPRSFLVASLPMDEDALSELALEDQVSYGTGW